MKEIFKQPLRFILALFLMLASGLPAPALPADSVQTVQQPVVVRQPDQQKLEAMRADKDFQYYEEVRPANTLWERIKRTVAEWLQAVFYTGRASGLWEVILYLSIAGAIVYVIVKLQHVDIGSLFGKKSLSMDVPYTVYEENIHEMDLAALIQEAMAQQDFRKAVRLHYLQSLKQLTDRGLIHWKPGKTNRSYIAEIQAPSVREEFERLTSMFEYVWYGGAAMGREVFASAQEEFGQFDNLVKQHA